MSTQAQVEHASMFCSIPQGAEIELMAMRPRFQFFRENRAQESARRIEKVYLDMASLGRVELNRGQLGCWRWGTNPKHATCHPLFDNVCCGAAGSPGADQVAKGIGRGKGQAGGFIREMEVPPTQITEEGILLDVPVLTVLTL